MTRRWGEKTRRGEELLSLRPEACAKPEGLEFEYPPAKLVEWDEIHNTETLKGFNIIQPLRGCWGVCLH